MNKKFNTYSKDKLFATVREIIVNRNADLKIMYNLRYEITDRMRKYDYQKKHAHTDFTNDTITYNRLVKQGHKDYSRLLSALDRYINIIINVDLERC